jgi:uncharacterized damage-inducible protein DinB
MEGNRPEPPQQADERATLAGFLDWQRATLAWKCEGLTDPQLRERAIPPSSLSLLGLVRHLTRVERSWFRVVAGGEDAAAAGLGEPGGREAAWHDVDTADVAVAFADWRDACDESRAVVAAAPSLDVTGDDEGERFSLRWIMAHMIEEYARHNGHADVLRERIDGATGE